MGGNNNKEIQRTLAESERVVTAAEAVAIVLLRFSGAGRVLCSARTEETVYI